MAEEMVSKEDKILAAASYAIGIPALYIILTDKRNERYLGYHGAQALFLWIAIIIIWIVLRVLLDFIWSITFIPLLSGLVTLVGLAMWVYALYCGYRAYMGEYFSIPVITDFAKRTGGL